jgi:hypothetical protein
MAHPIESYLPLLLAGDVDGLITLFEGLPLIADQRFGLVDDVQDLTQFTRLTQQWLAAREARVEPVALTQSGDQAALEVVLHLVEDRHGERTEIPLPLALVGEAAKADDGQGQVLRRLRTYHSLWPLLGAHQVRPPLLPARRLSLPGVVAAYQAALAKGDLEAILECFEADAVAREPSGGTYTYQGPDALRRFYGNLFANHGGIALEHCNCIDDGERTAIEYNVTRWGETDLPAQCGVAVYARGPGGKLAAARIYDDVEPPV